MKNKMFAEAEKRLGILLDKGMKDEVTNVFEKNSLGYLVKENVQLSVDGINFNLDEVTDLKAAKDEFEKQYGYLVYYGILTEVQEMHLITFLFVSTEEEEWEEDRQELKDGFVYAYVWNRQWEFGEFGSVSLEIQDEGRLARVA